MKKNITINLCGRLFQIDEDAYELLQQYINSLRSSFGKQEGGDEIVDDIETRIAELEKLLKNVEVVDADEVSTDKVSFGSKVKIHDMEEDEDLEYQIVGSKEANILQNRISNESPVGKALLGSRVGDTVSVEIPAGILKYKVLSIERAS